MSEYVFDTSATPHIEVGACGGELKISGVEENQVKVYMDDAGAKAERAGETLRIKSSADCKILCPPGSSITIQNVSGDLGVDALERTLAIDTVGGDAVLRTVGVVTLNHLSGDLSARDVEGALTIGTVGSEIDLRRIEGDLEIKHVSGDVSARSLNGSVTIGKSGGDVSIDTELGEEVTYQISASGDIIMRLPQDTDARFRVKASGEINTRLEFLEWSGNAHAAQGVIGSGSSQVDLQSGGDVLLLPTRSGFDFDIDFGAIGSQFASRMEDFESELESKMEELSKHIERMTTMGITELESRLSRIDVPDIDLSGLKRQGRKQASRIQREIERAQRKAERAQERARRQAERARHRAERARSRAERKRGKHKIWVGAVPSASSKPSAPPATEAERKMILQMLADQKISADEAARLLQALEG